MDGSKPSNRVPKLVLKVRLAQVVATLLVICGLTSGWAHQWCSRRTRRVNEFGRVNEEDHSVRDDSGQWQNHLYPRAEQGCRVSDELSYRRYRPFFSPPSGSFLSQCCT
jgi:hypothetical protein